MSPQQQSSPCPFETPIFIANDPIKSHGCVARPAANGWCALHQHSAIFLQIGDLLQYPGLKINDSLSIDPGEGYWLAYATRFPVSRIMQMAAVLQEVAKWSDQRSEVMAQIGQMKATTQNMGIFPVHKGA